MLRVWRSKAFILTAFVFPAALVSVAAVAGDEPQAEGGWLGVMLVDADSRVEVRRVIGGSPAAAAGIVKGDVIVSVDGAPVNESAEVVTAVRDAHPGESLTFGLERGQGERREVTAVLGEREHRIVIGRFDKNMVPEDLDERIAGALGRLEHLEGLPEHFGSVDIWTMDPHARGGRLGVSLLQPSDELRIALGGPEGAGVLVDSVDEDSPAARAGVQAGDLIMRIDGEGVSSVRSFRRSVRSRKPGTLVRLELLRGGATLSVDAELDETDAAPHAIGFMGPAELERLDVDLSHLEIDLEKIQETIERAMKELELHTIDFERDADPGPEASGDEGTPFSGQTLMAL
jgi:S1-C subfamily serine protease